MKATRIALLASIIFASVNMSVKADTIGYVYVPPPAMDSRACAFYTSNDTGQWYAISQSDSNFDEQLAAILMAKATGALVDIGRGSLVCGTPRAATFIH